MGVDKTLAVSMKTKRPRIWSLNNDCLAEIMSFLPLGDVLKVAKADEGFKSSVLLRFANDNTCLIDSKFLQQFKGNSKLLQEYLECFGKRAREMKFKDLEDKLFRKCIMSFKRLRDLTLSEVSLSAVAPEDLPDQLESLELDRCRLKGFDASKWFQKINPTLRNLRILALDTLQGLEVFGNIETITVECDDDSMELIYNVLETNKEHLKSVTLINKLGFLNIQKFLSLRQLESLHIDVEMLIGVPRNQDLLPMLKMLVIHVKVDYDDLDNLFEQLSCVNTLDFLSITIDFDQAQARLPPLKRFQQLKHLELLNRDIYEEDVPVLASLNLESLVLNCCYFQNIDSIYNIPGKSLRRLCLDAINIQSAEAHESPDDVVDLDDEIKKNLASRFPDLEVNVSGASKCLF